MSRHHTGAGSRAPRVLLGLVALAGMLTVVGAVPLVLLAAWHYLGPPWPSLHELLSPDDGTLFVRVLCLVGWVSWATFTWSVLAEILAQWRGWRVPTLGWRHSAAGLVTAITMMLSTPTTAALTAAPVRAAPVVVVTQPYEAPSPVDTAAIAQAPTTTTGYIEHQVRPGEQLPGLAQRYLGAKYQWQAIATATYGLPQPDGRVLRPGDTRIYPGWTVRIPTALLAAQSPAAAPAYQVRHGDWMWYVAERFLGDPQRYPEIAALNPGLITAHNGPHGPDHIEAGWHLKLPADAHDRGARTHAAGRLLAPPSPDTDSGRPDSSRTPPAPATPNPDNGATTVPTTPASPTPTASPSPSLSTSPSPAASPTASAPTSPAASPRPTGAAPTSVPINGHHQTAEDGSMLDTALLIGVPLAGAGLLATLLLTTLRRRRHRQEHHRPVGRRPPAPANAKVETQMRVVAQPLAVDRLDQALRALAAGLANRPSEQMPDIVGAWITGQTINLLLTSACPNPPSPWTADQLTWTLSADTPLPEVDGQLAPLPTLVAVGSQPGSHLLLDLERLGLLTITGDHTRAENLLRYLATELALNTWSDHVEVTIAGFDTDQTRELLAAGGDRLTVATNASVAIDRIRRRAGQVVQSLDQLEAGDPVAGRVNDIAADAWMPHVLLINNPNPDEITALEALDSDLTATGRCAVAIAITADTSVGRWPLSVDSNGVLSIDFLGLTGQSTITAAGLPRAELTSLADLLTTARRGARATPDAQADWVPVPPAAETEPWAQGTDAAGALLTEQPDQPSPESDAEPAEQYDPSNDEAPDPVDQQPLTALLSPVQQAAPVGPSQAASVQDGQPPSSTEAGTDEANRPPTVLALARPQPARNRAVSTAVHGHRHSDPALDTDLRAWHDADPARPRIAILGAVTVQASGQVPDERVRFYAEIITYLATRGQRGATTDQFDEAIWPDQPVKANTRRVAVTRARRWLGETPEGQPWLPDATTDRCYRLRDGYLLDWHLFRRLRSRGEARGPAGATDLHEALNLVRGAPLAGADVAYSTAARNPYPWLPTSDIQPHHLAAAAVDTAHRLVELSLDTGDITTARWAVDQAWLADPDRASDIAWRDLLRVAAAEGNAAELDQLLGDLMNAREAEVPEDLDRETYRLLCDLMPERIRARV